MSGDETPANPFVGLRPFDLDDSLYFFGRDRHTADVLDLLRRHHFVGVVGSSGCGKSSLVRAGVLPALLGGFLVGDRDHWHVATMRPGDQPIANLAAALAESGAARGADVGALARAIRQRHEGAILDVVRPQMSDRDALIVLVDQFEEIFQFRETDADASSGDADREREQRARRGEAADFVAIVMALARQSDLPIYVTLTMRSDFLGNCEVFYGLPEALNAGRFLVSRMTRQELKVAVTGPAALKDARLSARLVDRVLNDLGDRFDQLPMLQHALQRTWDAWANAAAGTTGGPIDLRHYEEAGTLRDALDRDASAALAAATAGTSDRQLVERVFRQLTDTDALGRQVRRPLRLSALAAAVGASAEAVRRVLAPFWTEQNRNFLYVSSDDDPRVDISHESLIRQWRTLRGWVNDEREWRDQYRKLTDRVGDVALQGTDLDVFLTWRDAAPAPGWATRYDADSPQESDGGLERGKEALAYLESSRQRREDAIALEHRLAHERERKRRRELLAYRVAIGAVTMTLLVFAASTISYYWLSWNLVPGYGVRMPHAVTWRQFYRFLDMVETNWVARKRYPLVDVALFRNQLDAKFADDNAVGYVNWHEATAFCDSVGGRLPDREETASPATGGPWLWTSEVDGSNVERRYVVSDSDGTMLYEAWNRREILGFRCIPAH